MSENKIFSNAHGHQVRNIEKKIANGGICGKDIDL